MSTKRMIGILGIFLVGIILGIIFDTFSPINLTSLFAPDVSSQVEKLYELINPGIDVSVVKLDQVSGMYKVLFKAVDVAGGVTYREAYITQDGKLMSENMILVEQSIAQLNRIRNFVDCLAAKDVRIAGISNQTATLIQFNLLGGSYATKLYLSCDGELAQQCVAANITQVPAVIYQGKGYPGVQSIQFFENLTACKF
ncbi:MAG: hypothetical protein QXD72_01720 [Candidatus Aenigmatarchaeota archaeon]